MSRFLFVVPPFVSHVNPTLAVGAELAARGHAVAWVAYAAMRPMFAADATLFAIESSLDDATLAQLRHDAGAPWLAGYRVLIERIVVPLARHMLPYADDAIARFEPDVVVSDEQALAGGLAARRRGIQWATSSSTAALWSNGLDAFPQVRAWTAEKLAELQRDAGVYPLDDPGVSRELVLLYTTRAFACPDRRCPASYRFVGPALGARRDDTEFPWESLRARPRVFVSLGSLFLDRGERFFATLVEALADTALQVVVHAPPHAIPDPPENFLVRPWVPLLRLYPELDAVVTHAGTTVNEALLYGLPSVVAPIAHEQSFFADRAVASGASIRIRFKRVSAPELRGAVLEVLGNPAYRAAAQRVQCEFIAAGGAIAAADALTELSTRTMGAPGR